MKQNWTWTGRYVIAIVAALVLGAVIGEMPVFHQATLGARLSAADLAKFIAYSGALALLWLLSREAADRLRVGSDRIAFIGMILVPLAALIIVSSAYGVLLLILKPFLSASLRNIYNWVFVLGITATALWLVFALFQYSEPMMNLFHSRTGGAHSGGAKCRGCGAALAGGVKYCPNCGNLANN